MALAASQRCAPHPPSHLSAVPRQGLLGRPGHPCPHSWAGRKVGAGGRCSWGSGKDPELGSNLSRREALCALSFLGKAAACRSAPQSSPPGCHSHLFPHCSISNISQYFLAPLQTFSRGEGKYLCLDMPSPLSHLEHNLSIVPYQIAHLQHADGL